MFFPSILLVRVNQDLSQDSPILIRCPRLQLLLGEGPIVTVDEFKSGRNLEEGRV